MPSKRKSIIEFEKAWHARKLATISPNFPRNAIVYNKYSDTTANGLTRLIIDYCKYHGWHAERINTQGRVIDDRREVTDVLGHRRTIGSVKRIPTAGMKGSADIHILKAGRAVFCEVKIGRDRQSEAQKEFQRSVEASGGLYIIVRDFDDFLNQIEGRP